MSLTDDESKLIDGIIAQHDRDRMAGEGWTDATVKAALRSVLRLRSAPSPQSDVSTNNVDWMFALRAAMQSIGARSDYIPIIPDHKAVNDWLKSVVASLSPQEPAAGESDPQNAHDVLAFIVNHCRLPNWLYDKALIACAPVDPALLAAQKDGQRTALEMARRYIERIGVQYAQYMDDMDAGSWRATLKVIDSQLAGKDDL